MLTEIVNAAQSLVWEAVDTKCEKSPTDQKVSLVGRLMLLFTPESCAKKMTARLFSPLRLLWWASLLYGARAQRTDPFPAQFELSSLDGTNGFVIHGEVKEGYFGVSVASDGDVNNDGIADILIGANRVSTFGTVPSGKSYVIFGKTGLGSGGTIELSNMNGFNGFSLKGEDGEFSGGSVSNAGDVNGDGIEDIIIGAPSASPSGRFESGKTYVIFGSAQIGSGGVIELTNLNGMNGFVINGAEKDDNSGKSVTSAGDVNGDGVSDVIIGAWTASPSGRSNAGKTFVVFGGKDLGAGGTFELSSINGKNGFILNGESPDDNSGIAVSTAGDLNEDGLVDLVIGAYLATPSGRPSAGKSYVVFGSQTLGSGGTIELSSLNGQNGFIINGEAAGDFSGGSVSSAGDVNGDGVADLVIRSVVNPNNPTGDKTYIIFGNNGLGSEGVLELSSLNGQNGFVLTGDQLHEGFGISLINSGDLNGDRVDDIVIGAPGADASGKEDVGRAYIIYGGKSFGGESMLKFSKLNNDSGFVINGVNAGDFSGGSLSCTSDVNGDGIADLLIGAASSSPSGNLHAGSTYIVFGRKLSQPAPFQFIDSGTHLPFTVHQMIGYAVVATTSVSCYIICGVLFCWRKKNSDDQSTSQDDVTQEGNPMYQNLVLAPPPNQQVGGSYSDVPMSQSQNQYSDWPQTPQAHDSSHYTDVDVLNRQHDQYVIDKRIKAQENYDSLNI